MILYAEVWVSHPDMMLRHVMEEAPGVTIRLDYQSKSETDDCLQFLRVSDGDFDAFERELRRDHTVSEPRLVAMFADRRIYRVTLETDVEIVPRRCTALGARVIEVRNDGRGWTVRLHLLMREALDAFREYCREHDVTYRVRELVNVDDIEQEYSFGLSETQRTTLVLAHSLGYYEIPRQNSQDDLADELGISRSAVSQRLRRAMDRLIESTLVLDDY